MSGVLEHTYSDLRKIPADKKAGLNHNQGNPLATPIAKSVECSGWSGPNATFLSD